MPCRATGRAPRVPSPRPRRRTYRPAPRRAGLLGLVRLRGQPEGAGGEVPHGAGARVGGARTARRPLTSGRAGRPPRGRGALGRDALGRRLRLRLPTSRPQRLTRHIRRSAAARVTGAGEGLLLGNGRDGRTERDGRAGRVCGTGRVSGGGRGTGRVNRGGRAGGDGQVRGGGRARGGGRVGGARPPGHGVGPERCLARIRRLSTPSRLPGVTRTSLQGVSGARGVRCVGKVRGTVRPRPPRGQRTAQRGPGDVSGARTVVLRRLPVLVPFLAPVLAPCRLRLRRWRWR